MPRSNGSVWKSVLLTVAGIYLLALVLLPLAVSFIVRFSSSYSAGRTRFILVADEIHSYLMTVFAAAWVFFLGGVFASFLNVVAARIPRGNSILGSSHCPHCNAKLSFKDNIPIWGWIKNEGRCSTCHLPIARRYLAVELTLGAIFLFVVVLELVTGGITLPIRPPDPIKSPIRMIFEPSFDLLLIVCSHLILILGLFVFALIELEREPIPVSVFLTVAVAAIAFPLILPAAALVSWNFPFVVAKLPLSRTDVLMGLTSGGVLGWISGYALERIYIPAAKDHASCRLRYGMTLIGMILGWQSAFTAGLILLLVKSIAKPFATRISNVGENGKSRVLIPHATLLLAVLAHLASWRWFNLLT